MATTTIYPDGDVTKGWGRVVPGPDYYAAVSEGAQNAIQSRYIESKKAGEVVEFSLGDTPVNTDEVQSVTPRIHGSIFDLSRTKRLKLELFHTGGTPVTGNPKYATLSDFGGSGVRKTVSATWSGLTLTKAQADSLTLRITNL